MLKDYIELIKPKITLLNILTAVTAHFFAGGNGFTASILSFSGFLAAGGASALNHYLDRDLDSRMCRTAKRPLPSGRIKPPQIAVYMGSAMILTASIISAIYLNMVTAIFIVGGAAFYIFYTAFLKRRTVWNIVIGGISGSFAPLAGWSAATGWVSPPAIILAILVFLWTPGHFWALAMRAVNDYRAAGLPMLPAVVGTRRAALATAISNILSVIGAAALIPYIPQPSYYLLLAVPISALLIWDSIVLVKNVTPENAWRCFKISSPWLALIFVGITLHLFIGG
ncbi:Protoheme IX farnesyltransferase [archaeon HR01]|nr:Protoheme IX farnesyltransferase [archaeon HR01]